MRKVLSSGGLYDQLNRLTQEASSGYGIGADPANTTSTGTIADRTHTTAYTYDHRGVRTAQTQHPPTSRKRCRFAPR